jgi:hypothetical protein
MNEVTVRKTFDVMVFFKGSKIIGLQLGPLISRECNLGNPFPSTPPDGTTHYMPIEVYGRIVYKINKDREGELCSYEPASWYQVAHAVTEGTKYDISILFPPNKGTNNALVPVQQCGHYKAIHPSCGNKVLQCNYCLWQNSCPDKMTISQE